MEINLSTENIDRIEIMRGPASVLYGSDATTGVVQIFTREGAGPPRATATVRAGTYSSVGVDADVVGGTETVQYSFGGLFLRTDGAYV